MLYRALYREPIVKVCLINLAFECSPCFFGVESVELERGFPRAPFIVAQGGRTVVEAMVGAARPIGELGNTHVKT